MRWWLALNALRQWFTVHNFRPSPDHYSVNMASKGKFRIPTLDEKDKIESNLTKGIKPLFKKDVKADDSKTQEKSSVLPQKSCYAPANTNNSNVKQYNGGTKVSNGTTDSGKQTEPQTTITKLPQNTTNSHDKRKDDSSFKTNESSSSKELPAEQDPESLPTLAKLGKTNSLIVNQRQRGNPILKHVRNVPWEFGNIVPDYVMGHSTCALFLSLRYHQLNPEYIHKRLKLLGKSFDLRVLLVQVDIKDPHHLLKDLAKMCILADCTLILAFSPEEAGRYLETYKVYENKPPEVIMEKSENNFMAKMTDSLTTVKSVNKTDCMTLMTTFGSLEKVMKASRDELSLCPGFGPQKAQRLHDVFHEPFLRAKKRKSDETKESSQEPKPSTSKSVR